MNVLVDTSVWVDYFNGYESPERRALAELIDKGETTCTCGVVVTELFQGFRRESGRREIETLFRELTFLQTSGSALYFRAAKLYRDLRGQGFTVRSTIDCLIATMAAEHGCALLARDRDLTTIIESGLLPVATYPLS